jgi:hypothetical protein
MLRITRTVPRYMILAHNYIYIFANHLYRVRWISTNKIEHLEGPAIALPEQLSTGLSDQHLQRLHSGLQYYVIGMDIPLVTVGQDVPHNGSEDCTTAVGKEAVKV